MPTICRFFNRLFTIALSLLLFYHYLCHEKNANNRGKYHDFAHFGFTENPEFQIVFHRDVRVFGRHVDATDSHELAGVRTHRFRAAFSHHYFRCPNSHPDCHAFYECVRGPFQPAQNPPVHAIPFRLTSPVAGMADIKRTGGSVAPDCPQSIYRIDQRFGQPHPSGLLSQPRTERKPEQCHCSQFRRYQRLASFRTCHRRSAHRFGWRRLMLPPKRHQLLRRYHCSVGHATPCP